MVNPPVGTPRPADVELDGNPEEIARLLREDPGITNIGWLTLDPADPEARNGLSGWAYTSLRRDPCVWVGGRCVCRVSDSSGVMRRRGGMRGRYGATRAQRAS